MVAHTHTGVVDGTMKMDQPIPMVPPAFTTKNLFHLLMGSLLNLGDVSALTRY